MAYENEPRNTSGKPWTYSRQRVIDAVTDFYTPLTEFPYLEPEEILYPPPGGWPNITSRHLRRLDKTEEVTKLLAHLPYVPAQGGQRWAPQWLPAGHETRMLDFSGEYFQQALESDKDLQDPPNYVPPYLELPAWVISLTSGYRFGQFLLLDTTDGTITRFKTDLPSHDPDYADDDPRKWRDECSNYTKPAGEYLSAMKQELISLERIPHIQYGKRRILWALEQPAEAEQLRQIYKQHGWPENFDREACKEALVEWDRHRNT